MKIHLNIVGTFYALCEFTFSAFILYSLDFLISFWRPIKMRWNFLHTFLSSLCASLQYCYAFILLFLSIFKCCHLCTEHFCRNQTERKCKVFMLCHWVFFLLFLCWEEKKSEDYINSKKERKAQTQRKLIGRPPFYVMKFYIFFSFLFRRSFLFHSFA